MASKSSNGRKRWLLAIVLAVIGGLLAAGGVQLALLGGSLYYLLAGIAVLGCAWLAFRGDPRSVTLYALMLGGTVIWALWEGGLDPWRLQSRVLAPAVLGIWACWPWLSRHRTAFVLTLVIIGASFGGWI